MPFLFEDYDEIEHVLAQTQGYYRRGYAEQGYVLLGWFDIGFVYLFSQKPIAGVDDIRGLKVWRLQGEPVSEVLFAKIGVTSVPLSIPDVLLGLQTDLVEVVYTSPAAAIVLQWFTRVGYYSTLPINHVLGAFLVDRRAFAKLSGEHQQILREVSERNISAQRILNRAENKEALRVINDHGVVAVDFLAPEVELFKQVVAESLPDLKGRAFSDESFEMVHGYWVSTGSAGPRLNRRNRKLSDPRAPLHHRIEDGVLAFLTFSLVLLAVGEILLRNLFGLTLLWGDPAIRHLVLWAGFVGAAVAARNGRHLRIDAVLRALPPRLRGWVDGIGSLFSCGICFLLCHLAVRFVNDERTFGAAGDLVVATWVLQLIFPVTFAILAFRFGIQGFRKLLHTTPLDEGP